MSPKLAIVGVAIGTDSDERTGIEAGRGIGAGGGEELEPARRGGVDGGQLPPGEAGVEGGSGAGGRRPAAWERRAGGPSGPGGPEGAAGLRHGSAGRVSNRATAARVRTRVLALVRRKYSGGVDERFGPTLAAEHLASEDGLTVDHETLRRWLLAAGLWSRQRKRSPYRQRRERKAHFGELVQMDGSFHAWFEDRGRHSCLLTLVDDATGRSLGQFGAQETIWAAVAVLRAWIDRYGIPRALYTDWKNVYVRVPNADERVTGAEPF